MNIFSGNYFLTLSLSPSLSGVVSVVPGLVSRVWQWPGHREERRVWSRVGTQAPPSSVWPDQPPSAPVSTVTKTVRSGNRYFVATVRTCPHFCQGLPMVKVDFCHFRTMTRPRLGVFTREISRNEILMSLSRNDKCIQRWNILFPS